MPLPKVITRLNRRALNPLMRKLAGRARLMAIVIHHGRRSGRRYETPVLVFPQGATVTIALTYGTDVDWLKNVMAAGECQLIHRNQTRELTNPRMLPPDEGRRRMPAPIRLILKLLNVDGFVELDKAQESIARRGGANAGARQKQAGQVEPRAANAATVEQFWAQARAALGPDAPANAPGAWSFGDSPELADELLALVMEGRKTATCGSLWGYEAENEPIPTPGELSIVLDGAGIPRCVIETTEIRIMPMNEVDEQFAYDEGEDDRTWDSWYVSHETYFSRTLPTIGREFDAAMPLVLERFRKRYPG